MCFQSLELPNLMSSLQTLLGDLVQNKKIRARTKWKDVYPLFSSSAAYLDMLGTPGSNPLELFWDVVDELDQALDERVAIVESALKRQQYSFNIDTGEEDFMKVLEDAQNSDDDLARLSAVERKESWETVSVACLVFDLCIVSDPFVVDQLRDQALKIQAEEKRRAERRQRHLQDDLRYALKKLEKPIDVNATYEEVS